MTIQTLLRPLPTVLRPTDSLTPYRNNARTHSKKQIQQIANSIKRFGFTNPILIDGKGHLIAGHGRLAAAKLLGMTEVPTISLEHLSEDEKRAYIIVDNQLAAKAGWDKEMLSIEFGELQAVNFDMTLTGFEIPEIDIIMGEFSPDNRDDDDNQPVEEPDTSKPAVSRRGDIFLLGNHRLDLRRRPVGRRLRPADAGRKGRSLLCGSPL